MIPTLLGVLTVTFVIIQFVPGGPVEQLLAEVRAGDAAAKTRRLRARGATSTRSRSRSSRSSTASTSRRSSATSRCSTSFAHFDLGKSFMHNKDVWQLIKEKLPVSISLGLWTFLLSYLISIPLGVAKAVREGTRFDTVTTLLVLVGYAIPGFVLGVLLIVLFAGGTFLDWFPLRGLTSDNWASLSWPARIVDYLWHLVLPLTCYAIGSFAIVTMLTKNTFVEEIRKQYVLVARAKGLSERRVLYKHVFRNALIPIVTGFPAAFVGAFFAGSILIETLFSLDGLGLLSYESLDRAATIPVVLGTLYFFTLIGLVVKLIGDLLYVVVDPRVQFGGGGQVSTASAARRSASAAPQAAATGAAPRTSLSPNQRAWARFKRNRLGYVVAVRVRRDARASATFAELVLQRAAARRALRGRVVLPGRRATSRRRASAATSRRRPTGTTRSSAQQFAQARQLRAVHVQRVRRAARSTTSRAPPTRRRRARDTGSAPTQSGRDMTARLLYGFRVSICFGLALTVVGAVLGILIGALQGYFGGRVDLATQRVIEIWNADPRALPADHHRVDLRAVAAAAARRVRAVRLDRAVRLRARRVPAQPQPRVREGGARDGPVQLRRSSGGTCCPTR